MAPRLHTLEKLLADLIRRRPVYPLKASLRWLACHPLDETWATVWRAWLCKTASSDVVPLRALA